MSRSVDPAIAAGTMARARQPTIVIDDELTARPFRFTDIDRVIEAFADPDIAHWHARRVETPLDARRLIGLGHALWLRERAANFAIADQDDRLLGRVALHTDLVAGTAEITYWVLPDVRGLRVATRAGRAVTEWGFDVLGLHRIVLDHAADNVGSCGVAREIGYALESVARSATLLADGRHDVHVHVRLRPD